MTKGIEAIVKDQEKRSQEFTRSEIPDLKLKDGDVATLRFLTDGSDIEDTEFHFIPRVAKSGKNYTEVKACRASQYGECAYCAQFGVQTKRMFSLWAYIYHVDHLMQNPAGRDNPDLLWPKVGEAYKEIVQNVRLFQCTHGQNDARFNLFRVMFRKYRTLTDRDYEWARVGSGMNDTNYALVPCDKEEIKPHIAQLIPQLPPLIDVIMGKITELNLQGKPIEKEAVKKAEETKQIQELTEEDEELF